MPFSGGVFSRIYNWVSDAANDIPVTDSRMDAEFDGIAEGLTNAICRDGQSTITANIPFAGNKITGLGDPTTAQDAATKAYVDAAAITGSGKAITATGSSNAFVVSTGLALSSATNGMAFSFVANHTSTAAATLAVDSISALKLRRPGDVATAEGDIKSGHVYDVVYSTAADSGAGGYYVTNLPPAIPQNYGDGTNELILGAFTTTDAVAADVAFRKSGSATLGSHSLVAASERLGNVRFDGSDGSAYYTAAMVSGEVESVKSTDGTGVSPNSSGDMPGRLVFSTRVDGAGGALTEQWRISSEGCLIPNGDTDTYVYRPSANTWQFVAGGTKTLTMNATGSLHGADTTVTGPDGMHHVFEPTAVGGSATNSKLIDVVHGLAGTENVKLRTLLYRHTLGADASGVEMRVQNQHNGTDKSYLAWNPKVVTMSTPWTAYTNGLAAYQADGTCVWAFDDAGTTLDIPEVDIRLGDSKTIKDTVGNSWLTRFAPDVIAEDQKSSGTAGGATSSTTTATRTLNTLVRNYGSLYSLSSNAVTLPAGTYYAEWDTPVYRSNLAQSRLYNQTDSASIAVGESTFSDAGTDSAVVTSRGSAVFTIAASKAVRLEMYSQTARATDGMGRATSSTFGEVYARLKIWRLG